MITIRFTYPIVPHAPSFSRLGAVPLGAAIRRWLAAAPYAGWIRTPYPHLHVALRRLRKQPRRAADDAPRPALPAARHRVARRLAADLRRRADGLGGRAG